MATRIHDLAAEFGISSEQVMNMLKEMDIFVRSHLTPLKDEQVAMMRARWEREKRRQKEPPAASPHLQDRDQPADASLSRRSDAGPHCRGCPRKRGARLTRRKI